MNTVAPIVTERLKLRTLLESDIAEVFGILSCPATTKGRSFAKETVQEAETWLSDRIAERGRNGVSWWLVETKNGQAIGLCGFFARGVEHELGYVIKAEYQKQGFGTEAVKAALTVARTAGLNIYPTIRPSNLPSKKVAERCGMALVPERFERSPQLDVYRPL